MNGFQPRRQVINTRDTPPPPRRISSLTKVKPYVQRQSTPQEMKLSLQALAVCTYKDECTFYITSKWIMEKDRYQFYVSVCGHEGNIRTIRDYPFRLKDPHDKISYAVAIDHRTLHVSSRKESVYLLTDTNWTCCQMLSNSQYRRKQSENIDQVAVTSIQQVGLSRIRALKGTDFILVCENHATVPVHSLVLRASWSCFDEVLRASEACGESRTFLRMWYPVSWVRAFVSFFYGEMWTLNFEDATGLMILGQRYEVPELVVHAIRRIRREEMSLTKLLVAWRRAYYANCLAIRHYCARSLTEMKTSITEEDRRTLSRLKRWMLDGVSDDMIEVAMKREREQ